MTATDTAFRWEIREGVPADVGYVIDTWGEAARSTYPNTQTGTYWRALRAFVLDILHDGASTLRIAHPPDAPELIWGWALFEEDGLLAFVYVRRALRGIGIARALCGGPVTTFTRLTADARKIKEKNPGAITVLPRF